MRRSEKKQFARILLYAAMFLVLSPSIASAYIDPGTGNILVYITISLFGALVYVLKSVMYRVIGGITGKTHALKDSGRHFGIALFSEGRNYWNTFKPIVNALLAKGQPFSYYTLDIEDPGLKIRNALMRSRYLGTGSAAFAKLNRVESNVLLATTPNIGNSGFPAPRPARVDFLVHVFHAAAGVAYYKKNSLDGYDGVLLVGDFARSSIRHLERLRNLPAKELIPAGLPYMDELALKVRQTEAQRRRTPRDGKPTILAAPSWGTKGFLSVYGSGFLADLAKAGYTIILRPHPQSWKVEKALLSGIRKDLSGFQNVIWDELPDGFSSMADSDILISDTSAIRMDYALLYEKPVITLATEIVDAETFELSDLPAECMDSLAEKICVPVEKEQMAHLADLVETTLECWKSQDMTAFREKNIYNFGESGEAIADYLIEKSAKYQKKADEKTEVAFRAI